MSTSSTRPPPNRASTTSPPNNADQANSYFHTQRALLVNEVATSFDTLLTQLNRLNRGLESVIAVGNEFSSVEALWSQFEGVMGPQGEEKDKSGGREEDEGDAAEGGAEGS
jgi:DASH complex subunit DAD1